MDDLVIANMRARVERCRWLALHCMDDAVALALRTMADEGEADIERVLRERHEKSQPDIETRQPPV